MKTLALALLIALPIAQTPRPGQTRDAARAPVTGTAIVEGRVVSDDQASQPLRKVSVVLSSGLVQIPQIATTDDAGRFRFAGLPAGTYTITATRPGFVPAFYGSKRSGRGPGIPVAVSEGQRVSNINVRMLRGSVITGTVRAPSGKPAPGLQIVVQQVQTVDGRKRMSSSMSALMAMAGGPSTTDDRGVFRIYGLPPGDYIVQATMQMFGTSAEARQVTVGEVQWAQQTAAEGAMAVAGSAAPPAPVAGQTVSYSPVFFPGTVVMNDASVITVGPQEERRGIDFTTQLVPTARVTGIVFDPEGRPLQGAQVTLPSTDMDLSEFGRFFGGETSARSGPDGSFMLSGIRPGRYTLTTRGAPPRPSGRQPGANPVDAMAALREEFASGMGGLLGGSGQPWWASEELTIDGRDLTNIAVRLQPGMTLSGKVVFEGATPSAEDLTRTRISFGAMPKSTSPLEMVASSMMNVSTATAAADGTFQVKNMTPGKYRASLSGGPLALLAMFAAPASSMPQGIAWSLKSVMWNGRDIADVALEVKPNEDVRDIVVTMTNQPTELSGAVTDQTGRPTGNFPIVVFSTDRTYWTVGSRRVQQARPASDGSFRIKGLPAGEYFVCAVTELESEDLANVAFLDQLAAASYKIQLADGQKLVQNLQLR